MIDWEDLATRQINKIPRALPSQSGLVQRRSRCFSARQGTNWDITLGGMKDRLQMSACVRCRPVGKNLANRITVFGTLRCASRSKSVTGSTRLQRLRKVRLLRRVQLHRNNFCRSASVLTVTLQLSLKEFLTRGPLRSGRNARNFSAINWDRPSDASEVLCAAGAFTIVPMEFAMQEPATSFHHSEQQR
jgi:hypothetical protein